MLYFSDMPPTNIGIHTMSREIPSSPPVSSPHIFIRGFDAFARWILVALFALLPVFLIPYPWVAISQGKVLLAAGVAIIAAVTWAIARLFEGAIRVPKASLLYVGLLLPLAYVISTAVGGWNNTSLVGNGVEQDTLVAVVLWYALFAISAFVFHDHRSGIRASVRAFIFGLTVLGILEVLYIFLPAQFSLGALSGLTANPVGSWHDLGIISGLSLFLSIALFRSGIFNGLWRIFPILLGALSLFLLIVIHFQDVFWATTALCAAGFIAVVRAALQAEGVSITDAVARALPWLVVGVMMTLLALFSIQIAEKLPPPIQITEVEVRPSWQGTFDIAKQSLDAPTTLLFGSGPNSFIREWGLHKPASVNLTPFWNSDFNYGIGVIPTSIFAVGLFGLLAWAAILLVLLGLIFRFVREVRPLTPGRTLFGTLAVAVAYLVTFHMIYTPGVAVTGITFLLIALLAIAASGDAPPRRGQVNIRSVLSIITLIMLLIFTTIMVAVAGYAGREVLSNIYVNKGSYVYQNAHDIGGAGRAIQTALRISPQNDRAHRAAAELGIVELSELLAQGTADDATRAQLQQTLQNTIQHALTAVEIDSANYQNWLSLAQIYSNLAGANVDGAFENAKNAYEQALQAQPTNPVPLLRLAQVAVAQGDIASARDHLQQAIALKPDFAAAYFLLSQVEAADGKGDPAVAAAAQAAQLVPTDPIGWFNLGYILYTGKSYENAVASLERAASLAPDYANAMFILGLSYNALGRTDDAIIVIQRVAALNTSETWLAQLIANMREGKDPFAGIQQ